MLPLYYKDGLTLAYISTSLMFFVIVISYYKLNEKTRGVNFTPSLQVFHAFFTRKSSDENAQKVERLFRKLFNLMVKSETYVLLKNTAILLMP